MAPSRTTTQDIVETRNGTLPAANADLLTTAISPTFGEHATLRIEFAPSVAGVLSVTNAKSGTTTTSKLFGGAALTASVLYPLEILVLAGESINFQYSATGGVYRLVVREV